MLIKKPFRQYEIINTLYVRVFPKFRLGSRIFKLIKKVNLIIKETKELKGGTKNPPLLFKSLKQCVW